jgi:hypothetical protein
MTSATPPARPGSGPEPLPESVRLNWTTIRSWRERGYRVSETRSAGWLYLLARSDRESAVYKIVGPVFDGQIGHYRGLRIA